MIRGDSSIISDGLRAMWDRHYAGNCPADCGACYAISIVAESQAEYEAVFGGYVTEDNVRFHAQRALLALDYLDTHIAARRPADAAAVQSSIDEAKKHLFKLVGTNSAVDHPPTGT